MVWHFVRHPVYAVSLSSILKEPPAAIFKVEMLTMEVTGSSLTREYANDHNINFHHSQISGFCHSVAVAFAPLGYYAASVFYRRFGTICGPHHQGSSCPLTHWLILDPLMMGPLGSPETSVNNYRPTLHNSLEEWRLLNSFVYSCGGWGGDVIFIN